MTNGKEAMSQIEQLHARQILDSRGNPTVEVELTLRSGAWGRAAVPSGASTGEFEATELRDGGEAWMGKGVTRAVANVNGEIAQAVQGAEATDQEGLDRRLIELDGTDNKSRLGANAILAVSLACAHAAAAEERVPLWRYLGGERAHVLPVPMMNVLNGGAHADNRVDFQEFMVVPVGAGSFAEAVEWAARVRAGAAEELADRGLPTALVADEGGLGPLLPTNRAALDVLVAGIARAGLRPGDDVGIAIDVAATQFVRDDGRYVLAAEDRELTPAELVEELAAWCAAYPIVSLEDALAEDDWAGWRTGTQRLAARQLLGDDLFVTNPDRLRRGIDEGVANAVLVKPNQIGTLDTARTVVRTAHAAGYATVLSARSGETEDDWLADLAVGWRTGQIKVGSTMRSERTAKWNRLLRLEAELGDRAEYAGRAALAQEAS
jgi:enolase